MKISHETFREACDFWVEHLIAAGQDVDPGHWQGVPTEGKPDLITRELLDVSFTVPMPQYKPEECTMEQPLFMIRDEIQPNLPWADEHFEERVGRRPTNPGEAYKNWPWWQGQDEQTMEDGKFTHTYQERMWPPTNIRGIRYLYGDLDDVVHLLMDKPTTRQAYLPIFFPEDTGAVHGGRIPCTLGYYFLGRGALLHLWYTIRSCDAVRHFRDDVYLAARLQLWVCDRLSMQPGNFHFHAYSFHLHKGDQHHLEN